MGIQASQGTLEIKKNVSSNFWQELPPFISLNLIIHIFIFGSKLLHCPLLLSLPVVSTRRLALREVFLHKVIRLFSMLSACALQEMRR